MALEYILNLDLIMSLFVLMVSFIMGVRYLSRGSSHLKARIKDREAEITDWKHKFNVMNGKFHRMANSEIIDKTTADSVSNSDKLSEAIPSLLQSASAHLPKGLSAIAKNPQIQNWLKGLADKYPEEAKQLLGKYLPQLTQIGTKTDETSEVPRL